MIQDLLTGGQLRGGGQLGSTSSATTLYMTNGKAVLTDGPFAETKEQLGGYYLVECRNLDEALSIAARIPTLPREARLRCAPWSRLTRTNSREAHERPSRSLS